MRTIAQKRSGYEFRLKGMKAVLANLWNAKEFGPTEKNSLSIAYECVCSVLDYMDLDTTRNKYRKRKYYK